ncbi:class III extradiol dioxygenase subunit B-like domain-containing protein [Actinoallomurus vinaceus]|uniref:Class III extradiol dioxygenase subunit B-like domain-containing protein n=1 Tax=Actinoallomurus vinaceus TaxID=1080074 RepID=A0ABP8U9U9_9ACTN
MLISAAVCPHPPLLVPEVASGAAAELDGLRTACGEAVRRLGDTDLLVVVGSGPRTHDFGAEAAGTLRPYGVDLTIGPGEPVLPLSLTIGRWLIGDRAAAYRSVAFRSVAFWSVAEDASTAECLRLGAELADLAGTVALLVMGDGSACRTQAAPGYFDARAAGFDAAVATALAGADRTALTGLDAGLAAELRAAGRAPWQVLAGAAGDTPFDAELLADEAPYGVGYLVASWVRRVP